MKSLGRNLQTLFRSGSVGGLSDAQLLERFSETRDDAMFEALLARHGPMVWGVCRRLLRDRNDAEDAFQATFLVLARKAASIARRELVAGWLHAVASKTAVRARARASRRRAREHLVAEMPDPEIELDERRGDLLEILDEELSRLPAKYRIPIVLCDLEGKTQKEAGERLGWAAGTVASRLARGRAMLARRIARRGASLPVGSLGVFLAREATLTVPPSQLIGATARAAGRFAVGGAAGAVPAAVADLTGEVLTMLYWSRLKVVLPLLMLALAGGGLAWHGADAAGADEAPYSPVQVPVAKAETPAPPPPKWAHLTSDTGFESWVRLADGRHLWKSEGYAGVHDPASATQLSYYPGDGPIVRRPEIVGVGAEGGHDVGYALDRAGVRAMDGAEVRRRMSEEGRHVVGGNFESEAEVDDLDGRRCLRIDVSRPDALGQLRLSEQTWYDLTTRRPVRRRDILQVADQNKYKREFRTTSIAYVDSGPDDIFALGVPAGTAIVDEAERDRVDISAALQLAFDGAARGLERLPRSLRIVDDGYHGLQLTYWSAPEGYLEAQAAFARDHADRTILSAGTPRSFMADHQGSAGIEILRELQGRPDAGFQADDLAAWLPIDQSVNVSLNDGVKLYNLTRSAGGEGEPRKVRVHVLPGASFNSLPKPIEETWGFAFDNRRNLKLVPAEPGIPEGWLPIQVEYPQIRELYYADPEHDYAVARKVEWSGLDGAPMRFRADSRAVRWEQLPGGVWYVSEWERLDHLDQFDDSGQRKPEAEQQADSTSTRHVVITPMDPEAFPAGILDGEKFLDAARAEGARMEVD